MSPTMMDIANPTDLKDKTEWNDWKPTFENFLRAIPGRNGIPLLYLIRDNELAILDLSANMHQDYINRTPNTGDIFTSDASVVNTCIVKFIVGNATTEAKILVHNNARDGRLDITSLKYHYEGVSIHARNVTEADKKNIHIVL